MCVCVPQIFTRVAPSKHYGYEAHVQNNVCVCVSVFFLLHVSHPTLSKLQPAFSSLLLLPSYFDHSLPPPLPLLPISSSSSSSSSYLLPISSRGRKSMCTPSSRSQGRLKVCLGKHLRRELTTSGTDTHTLSQRWRWRQSLCVYV